LQENVKLQKQTGRARPTTTQFAIINQSDRKLQITNNSERQSFDCLFRPACRGKPRFNSNLLEPFLRCAER